MSETLNDEELNEIERWIPEANPNYSDWPLRHVIASHRQLRAERDELRSCNEHHKAQFLQTNAALAAMRKERDALQAELAEARKEKS